MNRPNTYSFKNSPTCEGVGVFEYNDISHDVIKIAGRYPEEGYWARNLESRETVIVAHGIGEIALRHATTQSLDANDDQKRAVTIEPAVWFAWDGDMTISMVCRPSFDPNNYEISSEEDIERMEQITSLVQQYFPEDLGYVCSLGLEEAISFTHAQLLEKGEDPNAILRNIRAIKGENDEV